jgi:ribosome-binding protein aMBF1 (putative translation factor)
MSNDFQDLVAQIEAEATAGGPDAVARLHELRTRYRLANQITGLRRQAGWSQRELSDVTGVKQSEISRIETGVIAPSEGTWTRLAAAFGYELALVPMQ